MSNVRHFPLFKIRNEMKFNELLHEASRTAHAMQVAICWHRNVHIDYFKRIGGASCVSLCLQRSNAEQCGARMGREGVARKRKSNNKARDFKLSQSH